MSVSNKDMRVMVLIASLVAPFAPLWACSCIGTEPPCQAAWTATAVFTGTVLDIADPAPPPPQPAGPKPIRPSIYYSSTTPFSSHNRVVRMQIAEVLTGVDPGQKEIEIVTGMGGGDCGYSFQPAVDYIVYAYKNSDGRLETGICSRTRPLTQAAEDVAYLRAFPQLPATADIRVSVFDNSTWQKGRRPMPQVRTAISGPDGLREALTDSAGRANFAELTPGEYTVQWTADGYTSGDRKVQLHAKGCAEVPVTVLLDRRILGRVLTRAGLPAPNVLIEMVPVHPGPYGSSAEQATTDPDGHYEFKYLRTGDYYLGVNLDRPPTRENPYASWFFPGAADAAGATIVHLEETPGVQTFDLILPQPQQDRIIEGVVLWPDGRPARARLPLEDPRWPGLASFGSTDADGHFLLHSFDGTLYRLHAVGGESSISAFSAEPVEIPPGNAPLKLRLILTRSGDSFRQEREQTPRQ
jgi:Carboxypeptidase regulatory-like domain